MHYPWWYVPYITAPLIIGIVALLHVIVSHYAVGGGFFLAVETSHAYRTHNSSYLNYLRGHAWFFILVTVVYGAITGVGIWWAIGLASPLATEYLIRTFVFGWATEYVFFVIEIVSAFVFYYFWGRLSEKVHIAVGWIYAIAAWISLVLITGITSFMLNPGERFLENPNFWTGFFNPQFLPQVLARTGSAFLLASLYVYLHASFKITENSLKNLIEKRSALPALIGAGLLLLSLIGWVQALPPSARTLLQGTPVLHFFLVAVFLITIIVFGMFYVGPYRNPAWLTPGFSVLFFLMGLAAVTVGEFIRESVRKPYIIYNIVLGSQIYDDEIPRFRDSGILNRAPWLNAYVKMKYPRLVGDGFVDTSRLSELPLDQQLDLGRALFMYHCNDCHTLDSGLSSLKHLTTGWTEDMIQLVVENPEIFDVAMPPWAGTPEEAKILARFIKEISAERPTGMRLGEVKNDE